MHWQFLKKKWIKNNYLMISSLEYIYIEIIFHYIREKKKLLDKHTLDVLLNRLSCELIENHFDFKIQF